MNMVVALPPMQDQKALGFHQKYLNLCSEDKQRSYKFGTTWGWVINDRIFIFGWTIPVKSPISDTCQPVPRIQKCQISDDNLFYSFSVYRKAKAMNTFQCISAYAQLYQLITGITKQKQSSAILIKADYILSFKRGRKKCVKTATRMWIKCFMYNLGLLELTR